MFTKIFTSFVACMVLSTMVLAAPGTGRAVEGYFARVAKETGKSKEEVRKEAVEALRAEKKVSEQELSRIGRGESEFTNARSLEIINLLKRSTTFKARLGVAAMKNEAIEAKAERAFDEVGVNTKAEKAVETAAKPDRSLLIANKINTVIGAKATEALMSVSDAHLPVMLKVANKLAARVKQGAITKETAEQLIVDIAASPSRLEGSLIIGEAAPEACLGMAGDAVTNYARFIRRGIKDGKDPVSVTEGMGREAAETFKQELEKGIERVCALAGSGCRLFGNKIVSACSKMGARAAM